MFIKLTLRNDKNMWINALLIESITNEDLYSSVLFRGDECPIDVKETPEQIIDLIGEVKRRDVYKTNTHV